MGSQHTLDLAAGDTIVIVTHAATLRVDCHKMDGDWSLLLRYRTDAQCPRLAVNNPQEHVGDARRQQVESAAERLPLKEANGLAGRVRDDGESPPTEHQTGAVVDDPNMGQTGEAQESVEFGVIRKLGDLPPDAVISEDGLARFFGRCRTSIKRAVRRGELPPSVRMFGESVWTVDALRSHVNKRLEAADKEAKRLQQRTSRLCP
ncbi:MAG TPA: hypothetical protein VLI39_17425 [Sedimentisphaerales bacterium]|nr:hypothetical protein [Sedimentisphaerales bacterium]